jgi:hypothetical protein
MSEWTKELYCSLIVSARRFFGRIKRASEASPFSVVLNAHFPTPPTLAPADSLESSRTVNAGFTIPTILYVRAFAKILTSIVQRISVLVIPFFERSAFKDLPLHGDGRVPSSDCPGSVEAFRAIRPDGIPVPLRKPLEVGGVHDGILSLRKRDKFYRLVKRLDYSMSLHAFFHRCTSNALRFSRYLTILLLPLPLFSQVPVAMSPLTPIAQPFFSQTGVPLASGCVWTYASGTSSPLATYTDGTGNFVNSNPVILDSGGYGSIWLSNASYRFKIVAYDGSNDNCATGTLVRTVDYVSAWTILNQASNLFVLGASSDPSGTAGELAYRTDISCFRAFTTFWDCLVSLTGTQTLTNKTLASPAFTGAATGLTATSPTLNSPTINGLSLGGDTVSSGNPTNFQAYTNGAGGTGLNLLAKLAPSGGGSFIQSTAITDTGGAIGVVIAGAGTSGVAVVQTSGQVLWTCDGSTTAGDYVQISSTVIGNCHDIGSATYPISGGQVMGRVLLTNVGAGTYLVDLFGPEIRTPGLSTAVNLTSQGANITSTPILTPGGNGFYRFSCYVVVTQAATVSSTSPLCNVLYTDADTGVSETIALVTNSTANTVGAIVPFAPQNFYAKSGVAISYSTSGYATSGATSMQYALHIRLEGPY